MTPYQIISFNTHSQPLKGWLAVTTIYDDNIDTIDKIETIGHVFLQEEPDKRIKFLDAWVHPDHRRQGIYRALWDTRWEYVQNTYPEHTVYAWCLPKAKPLSIEKGFKQGEVCTYMERRVYEKASPTDNRTTS